MRGPKPLHICNSARARGSRIPAVSVGPVTLIITITCMWLLEFAFKRQTKADRCFPSVFSALTLPFAPFKKLINGVARLTFDSETAVKELSYGSLEELHDKYLYIAVTVTEASGKSVHTTSSWYGFRHHINSVSDFYSPFTFFFIVKFYLSFL